MGRLTWAAAGGVLAAGGALAVVLGLSPGGRHAPPITRPSVETTLTPHTHVFGDPVEAQLTLSLDSSTDPGTVSVQARFVPYRIVARRQQRLGSTYRYTYRLECLTARCVPLAPERVFRFSPAVVHVGAERVGVAWPPLTVASRLTLADLVRPQFRADLRRPPVRSAAIQPRVLGWSLAGGGALLAVGAMVLLLGGPRPRPQPLPEVAHVERRSPVEEAAAEVERALRGDDAGRRRALEALAAALDEDGRPALAARTRRLAWSAERPAGLRVYELLHAVRSGRKAA